MQLTAISSTKIVLTISVPRYYLLNCCVKNQELIQSSVIVPVGYECEAWSLIKSKECRLIVFENKQLRKIFRLQ